MKTDKEILSDLTALGGFFKLDAFAHYFSGVAGGGSGDAMYIAQWIADMESQQLLHRVNNKFGEYYITDENFQKIIRLQNLDKLLDSEG